MKKILLLAIVLIGCKSKREYWELKLPLHLTNTQTGQLAALLPDSVKDKQQTKGLLFDNGETQTYLSIPVPVSDFLFVRSVDKDGKEIENFPLFDLAYDSDQVVDVTVGADRTIVRIDSTYAWVVPDPDNSDVDAMSRVLSVKKTTFRISETGKVQKVGEQDL
jgi:hypothetical protein